MSLTTEASSKLKRNESNPSFNFQKKMKALNAATKKFMNNWELENYFSNNNSQSNININPSIISRNDDQDHGPVRIDSRMTDKTDISSIVMNDNDKKDNEDWFYNQFRQAFMDRINNSGDKNDKNSNRNSDSGNTSFNKLKKGPQIYKPELEKIQETKT